ncbi:unnamed protein product [Hymenolepis diminuta]|uniref:GMP synthase (glutamine-hydrolyzing) n=1 Tax=Hymenolepis diminuta TaxID=6216 RepID=A0A0R3SJC0_HYMDI|nr:unnamed protein product [Hymenolepis diminuta]VUZ46972.1 unnamed protein product [Hymenolepis diminuta]
MSCAVAILDAGAQYCKVIDRRVRELQVHSEIFPLNTSLNELKQRGFKAIIISGGPGSVLDDDISAFDSLILEGDLPVLGICYGMQLMNYLAGGKVEHATGRRDGQFTVKLDTKSPLFSGLESEEKVLLTHGDQCTKVPDGYHIIGKEGDGVVAISKSNLKLYGVQFHPEVNLTLNGSAILGNFLFKIAGLEANFKIEDRLDECIKKMKESVGDRKVLFMLSGGIDSTVCAAIGRRALKPEQITAIHINNGFMRKKESDSTIEALNKLDLNIKYIDASLRFQTGMTTYQVAVDTSALAPASLLSKSSQGSSSSGEGVESPNTMEIDGNENHNSNSLSNSSSKSAIQGGVIGHKEVRNIPIGPLNLHVVSPEEKRQIIGDIFVRVAEETWKELKLNPDEFLLCQGTLRPDLIESAALSVTKRADVIKTHHNVSNLVKKLSQLGRVIEPLADFHKDEVRSLGRLLKLPEEIVNRHPFPGPGLSIRIICASEPYCERDFPETTSLVKMIAGYESMSKKMHALLNKINEAISPAEQARLREITADGALAAHVLPIRSVGVQGDCRSYSYVCALSSDKKPDWDSLFFMAHIIPRICHNINRVVYAFGPRIATSVSEITVTYLREPVIETLREVDFRVNTVLLTEGCMNRVAQMPIVLIPIHFDRDPGNMMASSSILRSVVLRPFLTSDFMTGLPCRPGVDISLSVVDKMVKAASEVPGISRVLYDLTAKPPATTEWE